MDIRTYFNQRAAHWDDGSNRSINRCIIAFLSDIQEGMECFGCCLWYRGDV